MTDPIRIPCCVSASTGREYAEVTPDIARQIVHMARSNEPVAADKPAPVCRKCNDTHILHGEGSSVMCTSCPVPCQKCRAGGNGPYCEHTPCNCDCHKKADQPAGDDAAVEALCNLTVYDGEGRVGHLYRNEARGILAAIRRGEVPGVGSTAYQCGHCGCPWEPQAFREAYQAEIAALKAQIASEYEGRQMAEEIVDDYKTRLGEVLAERNKALADLAAERENRWTNHTPCCNGGLNEACDCPVSMTHKELAGYFIEEVRNRAEIAKALAAKEDAERAKAERNGVHVKNYREWMEARAEADALRAELTEERNHREKGENIMRELTKQRDALKARKVKLPETIATSEYGERLVRRSDARDAIRDAGVEVAE